MAGIGQYKQIKLVETVVTPDMMGDNKESVVTRASVWAEVNQSSGSRSFEHSQTMIANSATFKIRWNSNLQVNQNWNILYNGKKYGISSVERINEKRFNVLITGNAKS